MSTPSEMLCFCLEAGTESIRARLTGRYTDPPAVCLSERPYRQKLRSVAPHFGAYVHREDAQNNSGSLQRLVMIFLLIS